MLLTLGFLLQTVSACPANTQDELQHQLEVRGLDMNGNKEELANRLLDNLIAQVSKCLASGLAADKLKCWLCYP